MSSFTFYSTFFLLKNLHLLHHLIIDWSSDHIHSLSFPPPAFGSCFWHVQWCREDEVQISFAAQALCYRPCLSAVGEPTGTTSQIDLLKMPILHKSSHFLETLKGFACCCFPCRGRWACHWNSLMDWCDFTDPGCQQETASSRLKLSTPQGLRCSGHYLMTLTTVSSNLV